MEEALTKALVLINRPGSDEVFKMTVERLFSNPSVFIEGSDRRPEWAENCHAMISFDIRNFDQANHKEYDHLFKAFRDSYGPMIPYCWLPDVLNGRGRFYGLWKWQEPLRVRQRGHLRIVDSPTPEAEVAEMTTPDGTPSAE